jgi:predicted nucleotidyltransferase
MDKRYPRLSMNGFETDEQKQIRIQRALLQAQRAADSLKKVFDVGEVVLFGSLVETGKFGAHSDIDLAVRGIPVSEYYRANGVLLDVIQGFDFDLVDMDSCKPAVLESILRTGVIL